MTLANSPVLSVHHLSLSYPGQTTLALEDLTFSIPAGQIVGLLGHAGAGKTSLLRAIAGVIRPAPGTVRLGPPAESLDFFPTHRDSPGLDPSLSPEQHLAGRVGQADTQGLIEALNLGRWGAQPLGALPDSLIQRVWLAHGLLGQAMLMLVDEPPGFDRLSIPFFQNWLPDRVHSSDQTLILATHLPEVVAGLCDRVLVLRCSRLVMDEAFPLQNLAARPWPYQIRINGRLDPARAAWFEGLTIQPLGGETLLTGHFADQAALYGLLQSLRDLGTEILSIQRQAPTPEALLAAAMGQEA